MPKVLFCASTLSHINRFHLPYLKLFRDRGWEVHVAAPGSEPPQYADFFHPLPMKKDFLSAGNLRAVGRLVRLIKDNRYQLMLTHTALAGAVGRAALILAGKGETKAIHTVHGYLFGENSSLAGKVLYGLPELLCKSVTDCLVTMNREDARIAKKLIRRGGAVESVPGMGVDGRRFIPPSDAEKKKARAALSIPGSACVLVYAAEFSKRKNHMELIRAMKTIVHSCPDAILLLCGTGALELKLKKTVEKLGLAGNIRFLGWRDRMEKVYAAADLAVSPSVSEGLPFNIVEAQLCGLPVVVSRVKGHEDLVSEGQNGWTYPPGDPGALARTVVQALGGENRGEKQGAAAAESAKAYTLAKAFPANSTVYEKILRNKPEQR